MIIIRQGRSPQALLLTLLVLVTTSCSSGALKTYPVEGHVVYDDGSPVKGGTINFETSSDKSADGKPAPIDASGTIQADGSFQLVTNRELKGAVTGLHRVAIGEAPIGGSDYDVFQAGARNQRAVPPKYVSYDTSGLEVAIEPKSNEITITISRR